MRGGGGNDTYWRRQLPATRRIESAAPSDGIDQAVHQRNCVWRCRAGSHVEILQTADAAADGLDESDRQRSWRTRSIGNGGSELR